MNNFIHIFPREKFTNSVVSFMNNNMPNYKNTFYVFDTGMDISVDKKPNVIFMNELEQSQIKKAFKEVDEIYMHQLNTKLLLKYFRSKKIRNKLCWIVWGSDLYEYKHIIKTFKGRIKFFIKKFFISRLKQIAVFSKKDIEYAKKWYGFKGESFVINYPSVVDHQIILDIYKNKKKHEGINILLGNSATDTNQHMPIIDLLVRFKDYPIKVYTPLSYGDMSYRDKVLAYGKEKLGKVFIPMLDFMDPVKYAEFLATVDIALLNNNRQQGYGNVLMLGYFGAKIFMRPDVAIWEQEVIQQKRTFYDINSLKTISYDDFCYYDEKAKDDNHNHYSKVWDYSLLVSMWETLFKNANG